MAVVCFRFGNICRNNSYFSENRDQKDGFLCGHRALKEGRASIVVPVDKLSIVVSVGFASLFLKEKLNRKSFAGLLLIVVGTLILLIK